MKPLCQTTAKFPGTLEITTVFLISENLEDRVLKYRGSHPGMCGARNIILCSSGDVRTKEGAG